MHTRQALYRWDICPAHHAATAEITVVFILIQFTSWLGSETSEIVSKYSTEYLLEYLLASTHGSHLSTDCWGTGTCLVQPTLKRTKGLQEGFLKKPWEGRQREVSRWAVGWVTWLGESLLCSKFYMKALKVLTEAFEWGIPTLSYRQQLKHGKCSDMHKVVQQLR